MVFVSIPLGKARPVFVFLFILFDLRPTTGRSSLEASATKYDRYVQAVLQHQVGSRRRLSFFFGGTGFMAVFCRRSL
jgi:hypothetical protein